METPDNIFKIKSIYDINIPDELIPIIQAEDILWNLNNENIINSASKISTLLMKHITPEFVLYTLNTASGLCRKQVKISVTFIRALKCYRKSKIPVYNELAVQYNRTTHHRSKNKIITENEVKRSTNPVYQVIFDDNLEKFREMLTNSNISVGHRRDPILGYYNLIDLAASCGSVNIFCFLLKNNGDITKETMLYAYQGGNREIIGYCHELFGIDENCFYNAIKYHNNDLADKLLKRGICGNQISIAECLEYSNIRAALFLMENGFDINLTTKRRISDNNIFNPLGLSCEMNCIKLFQYLFSKGCKLDYMPEDIQEYSLPLFVACSCNAIEIVQFIIEKGTDPNIEYNNMTSVMAATFSENWECLGYLLSKGANINKVLKNAETALIYATKRDNMIAVVSLINYGADMFYKIPVYKLDDKEYHNVTALDIAALHGYFNLVFEMCKEVKSKILPRNPLDRFKAVLNKRVIAKLEKLILMNFKFVNEITTTNTTTNTATTNTSNTTTNTTTSNTTNTTNITNYEYVFKKSQPRKAKLIAKPVQASPKESEDEYDYAESSSSSTPQISSQNSSDDEFIK